MGLEKNITLPNGVRLNYHRIVSVNVITNHQNIVEVASYTSKAKRQEEQEAYDQARETGEWPEIDVLINTQYFNAPYDQDMTIISAYEWLKTLPEFKGADDVIEFKEDEGGEAE